MTDRNIPLADSPVCIHTAQITDCCLDKDCVEDLRVYLTAGSQATLDNATGAKARCAELMYTDVDVCSLPYKKGFYAVDLTFYYRIVGDALLGGLRPTTVTGLAVFAKRVVLYGGKQKAKTFRSGDDIPLCEAMLNPPLPQAVVEALDPMVLSAKVRELCDCRCGEAEVTDIPAPIAECFGEALCTNGGSKRLYVTLGQFSTIRLERDTQISVSACEYCAPTRECCDEECCEEDPCELFGQIDFPMSAFFPGQHDCGCDTSSGGCSCGS